MNDKEVLMNDLLDFWVLRDAPLTDGELTRLLESRPDLEPAGSTMGRTPDGRAVSISGDGMYRWRGPAGADDVLVSLSSEGIHIAEGGEVARDLANSIASAVGGWVHKG
jgi:hypothetical protein